jgi:predicted ATP-grasp superfamily ATP-dependent carboligase
VLLAGVSTRAAAESAARAGYAVTSIDAFADLDQHPSVQAQSLGRRFSPDAAARAALAISCDAVAYGSNFENHPSAIGQLARGRALWGNPSDVIRRVRDPKVLSYALRRRGLPAPAVADEPPTESQTARSGSRRERSWLVKPRASGGGHRVRPWRDGMRLPPDSYLQEFIDGTPTSIVFVASSGRAVPIGLCRQLIGENAFGGSGYRYCGNILTAAGEDDEVVDAACAVASAVCEEFGLVGVNGIDMMVKNGVPYSIEVNPRWCASMELVERAYAISVFGAHAAVWRDRVIPNFDLAQARRGARATGKAVVFARRDVVVGETRAWLAERDAAAAAAGDLRDIPREGTRIRTGRPVCTVFASGRASEECHAELARRANRVYALLDAPLG